MDEGTSQFWTVQEIGRHCWTNVHVSPRYGTMPRSLCPAPTTLTSRFGYLAGRLGGPLAPEDMALRINRLGAEGRCAISSIGESKVWILRDRYASLHFQQKLIALPETQFVHDEKGNIEVSDLVALQS